MLEQILVPLDGSDAAEGVLPFVITLAKGIGSRAVLLHVVDPGQLSSEMMGSHREVVDHAIQGRRTSAETYLSLVAQHLNGQGIEASTEVATGEPGATVASRARCLGAGLIAMSTRGRSGLARLTLGSTATRVLHESPIPVLLYRPGGHTTPSVTRVLLPLDGSAASEEAIPLATFLARVLGLPLVVVRVVPLMGLPYGDSTGDQARELLRAREHEAKEYLRDKLQELRATWPRVEKRLLRGDPAEQLIDVAQHEGDALVVMSSRGRIGLPLMVLGSVADKVVRYGERPVAIVRSGKWID